MFILLFDFFHVSDLKPTFTSSLALQQSLINLISFSLILSKYSQNDNKFLSENDWYCFLLIERKS